MRLRGGFLSRSESTQYLRRCRGSQIQPFPSFYDDSFLNLTALGRAGRDGSDGMSKHRQMFGLFAHCYRCLEMVPLIFLVIKYIHSLVSELTQLLTLHPAGLLLGLIVPITPIPHVKSDFDSNNS
jgi:hypothetical protein